MLRSLRFIITVKAIIILCVSWTAFGQKTAIKNEQRDPRILIEKVEGDIYVPSHITKKPGHYTITDWDEAIDNTWGSGLSKDQKLNIFDTFWTRIDEEFACFVDHPDYYPGFWDDLRDLYRTQIETGDPVYGVSRGRFAAIMNHICLSLKETHTWARDNYVNVQTALEPGVPLLVVGAYGEASHFGAGLTPLEDSSLLVYRTVQDHPLGLVPGDIVLGYDGTAWKDLYQELIDAQLPIYLGTGCFWGASESAYTHSWLKSAGMNWHLFDTIDVVKYATGDTLHLSVEPLIGQNMNLWSTEQLDIPGVPMPNYYGGVLSTYGVIEGTQIGYIYVAAWNNDIVEGQFYDAVYALVNNYETTGLIIDYRGCGGGAMHLANKGYNLLFNTKEQAFGHDIRCNSSDHLSLCPSPFYATHYVYGSADVYYDNPIAVLTGPMALSAADLNALILKSHPTARFFGEGTCGAFNMPIILSYLSSGWPYRFAKQNCYLLDDPGNHLTRMEFEVDEVIWFTPDDVAQGNDTVVDAAVSWINSQQGNTPAILNDPVNIDVSIEYGQVITRNLTINNIGTEHLFYSLTPEIGPRLKIPDNGDDLLASYSYPLQENYKQEQASPIISGHSGPDEYGHVWIDSDQPHGPSYEWVDISDIGTPVNLGDNSFAGPIDIGFDFPFYENIYSQLYVCSNGLISFGGGSNSYDNVNIPNSEAPNNFIAPWWDNLNPSAGGNIYIYSDEFEERFILSFENVPKYSYGGSHSFQTILYSDGRIKLNLARMHLGSNAFYDIYTATIGIENSFGTDGLEIYYMAPYTFGRYSVLITTDWLAVSPSSSHIAPGENEVANVTFNAKHLIPGSYTGNIYLESNDPDEPSIVIPVSLEVTGGCEYEIGDFNGSGVFNVADIIDSFSKLKTGLPDPAYFCECPYGGGNEWAVAMDLNNSCNFNIADIIWGFGKLRGQPNDLVPCADCPPTGRILAPDKGDLPVDTPTLEAKVNSMSTE